MMQFGPSAGTPPVLNQPDQRMGLARLMMPQAPGGGGVGSLINPAKIFDFASRMRKDAELPPPKPGDPPDLSGNVMNPEKPFGKFANWLAGSEGLLGSNGFFARQFGAQPSAMNAYSGPPIGQAPMSAFSTPPIDPNAALTAIPSRIGG